MNIIEAIKSGKKFRRSSWDAEASQKAAQDVGREIY